MKTIFFCHDTQANPRARSHDLEMAGYQVLLVPSGVELLRMMANKTPDLILLDILLEGDNGFDVCKNIQARPGICPPIIMFAGVYSRAGFRLEALRLGAKEFLSTELFRDEFLDAVVKTIGDAEDAMAAA